MDKIKATIVGATLLVAAGSASLPLIPLDEAHEQFVGATQVCKSKNGTSKETSLTQAEYRDLALPDAPALPPNCMAYEMGRYDTPSGDLDTGYYVKKDGKFYRNGGKGRILELETVPRETLLQSIVN